MKALVMNPFLADAREQLKDFFKWWGEGLLLLLPARWLARLRHQPDTVTVEQRDDTLVFRRYTGRGRQLSAERSVAMEDESEKAAVKGWFGERKDSPELVLLLPRESRLQKHLTYPLAAEKELRSVLEFDLDKQTPFTNDKVYFDYTITGKDSANDQLHITLFLVLRDVLQQHLDAIGFLDLQPAAATTAPDDTPEDVNFMPFPDATADNTSGRSLVHLCLATFLLFMTALYLPLLRYDSITEQFENRVEQARAAAMHVQALENNKQVTLDRINFFSDLALQHTPFIEYIHELTGILQDDTWISRLAIRDGEIHLQGEADGAASMIPILEASEYFKDARFRSPVTKNNATGKEEFHVVSKINSTGPK